MKEFGSNPEFLYYLGLLQAMNYCKFIPWVDYLSTVSGGGYVGSPLTWFILTNMVTVGSDDPKSRARGGENFIFSPGFVGSEATSV